MIKKRDLRKGIYSIKDDLTKKEREIQRTLWRRAMRERGEGKDTRVGYMKMRINVKWRKWNEWDEKLDEGKERGGRE